LSPNRQKHREAYRKIGAAISNLEREWRIARGESPNPWRGKDSKTEAHDCDGRTRVMQIVNNRPLSKLELRSLALAENESAQ